METYEKSQDIFDFIADYHKTIKELFSDVKDKTEKKRVD
jgi:hypothetical protein